MSTEPSAESHRPSSRVLIGIALLSFCVLALEVALTRLFGWVLRYHFAFFAISLAMCGLGLGGYLAHLWMTRGGVRAREHILVGSSYGIAFGAIAVLVLTLRVVVPAYPTAYALVGALMLLPFLCAGAGLAVLFREYCEDTGRLYAADLLGAALAAAGSIVLLDALGAIGAVLLLSAIAFCLPLFFAPPGRPLVRVAPPIVLSLLAITLTVVNHRTDFLDLPLSKESLKAVTERLAEEKPYIDEHGKLPRDSVQDVLKGLLVTLADPSATSRILYTDWNAFGRTDVQEDSRSPDVLHVWLDGEVPAVLRRADPSDDARALLRAWPAYLPYRLQPMRRVLSLGSGGGLDVMLAKEAGVPTIDAIDINPAIPRVMDRFRAFHGAVYDLPGVSLEIREGRSFVKQTSNRYDLIVLSLTQTATSGNVGTALMESYVHTREACRDYVRRLDEGGIAMLVTGYWVYAYRWFATCAVTIAEETGQTLAAAMRHLALVEQRGAEPYQYLVLMRRDPFTESQLRVFEAMGQHRSVTLHCVPGVAEKEPFKILESGAGDLGAFVDFFRNESKIDVAPVTDDSPYFSDVRLRLPESLWQVLGLAMGLTVVFATVALAASRGRREAAAGRASRLAIFTLYFASLGVAFMLVEVGLIQRLMLLLGSPTHTVALILFSILMGAAAGSAISQRFTVSKATSLSTAACLAVSAAALVLGAALGPIAEGLLGIGMAGRVAATVVLCAALGVAMGVPFPAGIQLVASWSEDAVPYFWGVNGVASVIGSVLAAMAGRLIGFGAAVQLGALVYLVAAVCVLLARRIGSPEDRRSSGRTIEVARLPLGRSNFDEP